MSEEEDTCGRPKLVQVNKIIFILILYPPPINSVSFFQAINDCVMEKNFSKCFKEKYNLL